MLKVSYVPCVKMQDIQGDNRPNDTLGVKQTRPFCVGCSQLHYFRQVIRRPKGQLLLQLSREDLRAELLLGPDDIAVLRKLFVATSYNKSLTKTMKNMGW